MAEVADKTICVSKSIKDWLDSIKLCDDETYNNILARMKKEKQNHKLVTV